MIPKDDIGQGQRHHSIGPRGNRKPLLAIAGCVGQPHIKSNQLGFILDPGFYQSSYETCVIFVCLVGIGAKVKNVATVYYIRNSLLLPPGEPLPPLSIAEIETILVENEGFTKGVQEPPDDAIGLMF